MREGEHPLPGELLWNLIPVLDHGFVCLVDVMGDDGAICDAARVSYGRGTRSISDDRTLIRYLMRNRHTSPFEMAEIKLLVKAPMDCWRQWIRHRTANVNEHSTRYSEAIDDMQATPPDAWRLQSPSNKQGSDGHLEGPAPGHDLDMTAGEYLTVAEANLHDEARKVYRERLRFGVAREQARKDLPLSTYTLAYWKIDLHNLLHFLSLRMDGDAQLEIRSYAEAIGRRIVAPLFPLTWEAFEDYRLNAITLSAPDIEAIRKFAAHPDRHEYALSHLQNARERRECLDKLRRLGLHTVDTHTA